MDAPQVRMSAVFAALLSIAAVGCGCPEPMELTENREGTLVAAQVAAARDENSNDEARCAWACQRYLKGAARAAKVWTTSNTAKGHGELARRLKELGPERIALEATGGHFWNFLNDPTGTDFQPQVVEIAALVEQMYVSGGLSPANAFSRLTTALNTAGFAFWNDHWSSRATTHGVIDP